jgi:DNA-directed RNA polymerase alpha subunit
MSDLTSDTFEDVFVILMNLKPIATMSDTFKDSRMFFFIFGEGVWLVY